MPYFSDGKHYSSLVTNESDPAWSDFVYWVLQSLLAAEEQGITSMVANRFEPTSLFAGSNENIFADAISAVGNYGEIYSRNMEMYIPRECTMNRINKGNTGLIKSLPFGNTKKGVDSDNGSTLDTIKTRGYLKCGVVQNLGFGNYNAETSEWAGFDVDFCRALSAAIFQGRILVEYTELSSTERFVALADSTVDILSRITTHSYSRDVCEPMAGLGFTFSEPNFYDGMRFAGTGAYLKCAEDLDTTSSGCTDLKVCVQIGTTYVAIVKSMFDEANIEVANGDAEAMISGFANGDCNVLSGGLFEMTEFLPKFEIELGSKIFSKETVALITRQDDAQWSDFVYWFVQGIFYAEEEGITQANCVHDSMPKINLFGPEYKNMLNDVIKSAGNYGEIYERNLQSLIPRSDLNNLNRLGPMLYPLPF